MEDEIAELRKGVKQEEVNAPDPVQDPDGYEAYIAEKVLRKERTERIETSRSQALEKHPDYIEMEKVFMFLNSQDPALAEQMNKHPDPAGFAYETAKNYRDTEREKLRAEILADLEKEKPHEPSEEEKRNKSAVAVPDLTKAAAIGSNTAPKESLATLDDVL